MADEKSRDLPRQVDRRVIASTLVYMRSIRSSGLFGVPVCVRATLMCDLLEHFRRDPNSVAVDQITAKVARTGEAQRSDETSDGSRSRVWPPPSPHGCGQQRHDRCEDDVPVEYHLLVSGIRMFDPAIGNQAGGDGPHRSEETDPPESRGGITPATGTVLHRDQIEQYGKEQSHQRKMHHNGVPAV